MASTMIRVIIVVGFVVVLNFFKVSHAKSNEEGE